MCLVTQSCLTLYEPMDRSLPDSPVHGDSTGTSTGVGCHALLQGIFPTQASNPGLPLCRWILHKLSCQGSPSQLYFSIKKSIVFIYASDEHPKTEIKKAILYIID